MPRPPPDVSVVAVERRARQRVSIYGAASFYLRRGVICLGAFQCRENPAPVGWSLKIRFRDEEEEKEESSINAPIDPFLVSLYNNSSYRDAFVHRCDVIVRRVEEGGEKANVKIEQDPDDDNDDDDEANVETTQTTSGSAPIASRGSVTNLTVAGRTYLEIPALCRSRDLPRDREDQNRFSFELECLVVYTSDEDHFHRSPVDAALEASAASSSNTLSDDLESLLDSGEGVDATFQVGGEEIGAHKAILRARSSYFREMLDETNDERGNLKIEGVDPQHFREILRFVYTDRTPYDFPAKALDFLLHAHRFCIPRLRADAAAVAAAELTDANACRSAVVARRTDSVQLERKSVERMREARRRNGGGGRGGGQRGGVSDLVDDVLEFLFESEIV